MASALSVNGSGLRFYDIDASGLILDEVDEVTFLDFPFGAEFFRDCHPAVADDFLAAQQLGHEYTLSFVN